LSGEVTVLTRCFDKNKPCVAVGYSDGQINVYNYLSKSLVTTFRGHTSAISCLIDLSLNSNSSLTSMRAAATSEVSSSNKRHQTAENNYYLASGGCDCNIIVWDLISLTAVCKLRGHKDAVTDLTFLTVDHRKLLISVSKDTLLKVWCMDTQACIQTIVGHRCEIWSVSLIGDSGPVDATSDISESKHVHTQTLTIVTGGSDDVLRGYSVLSHGASPAAGSGGGQANSSTDHDDSSSSSAEDVLRYIGSVSTQCGQDKVVRLSVNSSGE
jgi:U3 small nucleolar RNA-associated protein 12